MRIKSQIDDKCLVVINRMDTAVIAKREQTVKLLRLYEASLNPDSE